VAFYSALEICVSCVN